MSELDRPVWGAPAIAAIINRSTSQAYYLLKGVSCPVGRLGRSGLQLRASFAPPSPVAIRRLCESMFNKEIQRRWWQTAPLQSSISFPGSSHQQALLDLFKEQRDIIQLHRDGKSIQGIDEGGDMRADAAVAKAQLAIQISVAAWAIIKSALPS